MVTKREMRLLDAKEKIRNIITQNLCENGKEWFYHLCSTQDRINKELKKSDDNGKSK